MIVILKAYGREIKGIIHVGAHVGQEYSSYNGIKYLIFFEPVKANYEKLIENIKLSANVKAYNLAVGNETGIKEMFIETANQGMSNSILEPKEHLSQFPWIEFTHKEEVRIDKLDNIKFNRKNYNVLKIDTQGYELEVLKGAVNTLKHIDSIFVEVNNVEMYKGCPMVKDIDDFLIDFKRVEEMKEPFGNALYIKQ